MDDAVRDDAALGEALRQLGTRLAYPETPDLAEWAALEVAAIGLPPPVLLGVSWALRPLRRNLLAVAAAVVLVIVGVLTLSPRARAIADDLIHLRGVRVDHVRRLPPAGTELHLGRAVSLADAGRRGGWRIVQPRTLGPPDAVFVTEPVGGQSRTVISLVYRARPGLPAAPSTGAALILSEFRGQGADPLMIKKLVGGGTAIDFVTVNGAEAYWIPGPHVVVFVDQGGTSRTDLARLSASTVLWSSDGVTYRLESTLGEVGALQVANSVR